MRLSRHVFLLLFVLVALVAVARAQDDQPTNTDDSNDNTPAPTQSDEPASTADDDNNQPATTGDDSPATTSAPDDQEPDNTNSSGDDGPTASTGDNEPDTATSADATGDETSQTDAVTAAPTNTNAAGGGGGGAAITGAPSLINAIPNYPAATIPPTADAPFMQRSDLPQGTVFICVGAVLAFAFVLVLTWRGLVAYSIRRSIKRANTHGYLNPAKDYSTGGVGGMVKPFYSQGMGSSLSLDPLTGAGGGGSHGKGGANGGRPSRPGFMPQSTSSLFFSPTAGANIHGPGHGQGNGQGNRGSGYLPAGYYAAGASVAGQGIAGNGRPISMADFTAQRPQSSSGYARARYYDNPDSPGLHPAHAADPSYGRLAPAAMSSSSLTGKSDGRAPSTFLDDLFDYPPVPQHGGERR